MFSDLTDEQLARLTVTAEAGRKRAKRWLHNRKLPCDSPALDAALAEAASRPGVAPLVEAERRLAAEQARQAEKDAVREATAKRLNVIYLAAVGRWADVARMANAIESLDLPCDDWSERYTQAVAAHKSPMWVEVGARCTGEQIDWIDWSESESVADLFSAVWRECLTATQDESEASAIANLEKHAVKGGPWAVATVYRKTLGISGQVEFEDEQLARDYWVLTSGGNSTSAFRVDLIGPEAGCADSA